MTDVDGLMLLNTLIIIYAGSTTKLLAPEIINIKPMFLEKSQINNLQKRQTKKKKKKLMTHTLKNWHPDIKKL